MTYFIRKNILYESEIINLNHIIIYELLRFNIKKSYNFLKNSLDIDR